MRCGRLSATTTSSSSLGLRVCAWGRRFFGFAGCFCSSGDGRNVEASLLAPALSSSSQSLEESVPFPLWRNGVACPLSRPVGVGLWLLSRTAYRIDLDINSSFPGSRSFRCFLMYINIWLSIRGSSARSGLRSMFTPDSLHAAVTLTNPSLGTLFSRGKTSPSSWFVSFRAAASAPLIGGRARTRGRGFRSCSPLRFTFCLMRSYSFFRM